jgi:hypothetical protein
MQQQAHHLLLHLQLLLQLPLHLHLLALLLLLQVQHLQQLLQAVQQLPMMSLTTGT